MLYTVCAWGKKSTTMLLWTSDATPRDAAERFARQLAKWPDGARFPRGEYVLNVYRLPTENQLIEEQESGRHVPAEKVPFTLVVGGDGRTEVYDDPGRHLSQPSPTSFVRS
jgi:hypothetical protein